MNWHSDPALPTKAERVIIITLSARFSFEGESEFRGLAAVERPRGRVNSFASLAAELTRDPSGETTGFLRSIRIRWHSRILLRVIF